MSDKKKTKKLYEQAQDDLLHKLLGTLILNLRQQLRIDEAVVLEVAQDALWALRRKKK